MTVPFSFPLLAVAAVQAARTSHARREEQEADDQRYATLRKESAQFRLLDDEPLLIDKPMIEQNHPITPPPELVEQWHAEAMKGFRTNGVYEQDLTTQAARWGADQELEACCKLLNGADIVPPDGAKTYPENLSAARERMGKLRAARRPKPQSLKEQALAWCNDYIDPDGVIRRALEALPDD